MMDDRDLLNHQQRRARRPVSRIPLKRSTGLLGGVAAGVAIFVGANPKSVRLLFLVALIVTFGFFGLVYIALWILLPKA
jgi:phage shock protein PspC (stress-responsive transcriptional regulator)